MVTEYIRSNQSRCYSHGYASAKVRQVSLSLSLSLSLFPHKSLSVRNRAGLSPTRRKRKRRRIRVFRLLATPVRFGRNERGGGGGAFGTNRAPYTFGLPLGQLHRRPFIRRPCLSTHVSTAIPAGAPSLHSYPSMVPSMILFIFVLAFEDVFTSMDIKDISIDSIFMWKNFAQVFK